MKEGIAMIKVLRDALLSLDLRCIDKQMEPDFSKWQFKKDNHITLDSNQLFELTVDTTSISIWKEKNDIYISYALGWLPTIQGKMAFLNYKDDIKLSAEQCHNLGYMVTYSKMNVNTLNIERYKLCNYKIDGTYIGCNSTHVFDSAINSSNPFQIWGSTEILKYVYGKLAVCHEQKKCFQDEV